MTLPRIEVLTTGGTIAGTGDSATGSAYHSGELTGEALLASVPGLGEVADITVRQIANIPSQDMNETVWLDLARAIEEDHEKFDGFVVTHGTDTMEETAFFLELTLPAGKPVVLTGAMLPSTAISADGPRNIFNAVCTAACPKSADYGVLVAMNSELFTAKGLLKSHTTSVATFRSRLAAATGWTQNGEVHFTCAPASRKGLPLVSPSEIARASSLPRVALVATWAGVDGVAAAAYIDAGYQGLVIEGMGDGNVPAGLLGAADAAVKAGMSVVRSSRSPFGAVLAAGEIDDKAHGFICSGSLSPAQSRVLLQLALFASPRAGREKLQTLFNRF